MAASLNTAYGSLTTPDDDICNAGLRLAILDHPKG
jgi:hypothetical protein